MRAVLDMCAGQAKAGHEVTAVSTDDSGVPAEWKEKNPAKGYPRNLLLPLRDPFFERGGRSIHEATRDTVTQYLPPIALQPARELLRDADVLHVHGVWANVNLQMIYLARQLKVGYVISPHGMLDDWSMAQGSLKKRIHLTLCSRRYLAGARAVHCTAQAEAMQASVHFTPRQGSRGTVVVPLLFDTSPFQEGTPSPEAARLRWPQLTEPVKHVLFLSRLHHKKGVVMLLEALRIAVQAGKPFHVWLAGPADPPEYLATLLQLTTEYNISQFVHFVGMVTGDLKWSLYAAADLFVLPTSQENFGYVLLEALACGTPLVTTTGVDIWPELEQSGGAHVLKAPSSEKLCSSIITLLEDTPTRNAMGVAGRQWALQFLDHNRTIAAMEAMYRPLQ